MVFIGCDGEVAPCNQLSGVMRTFKDSWGNVKKEGLKSLLKDSVYLKYVTATVDELFEKNKLCGSCKYRKLCLGGCRAIGYGISRDYFGEDFMKCAFFLNCKSKCNPFDLHRPF
jgi:radical SAM protein with 4Fe4S-binding SPASM domain